MTIDPDVGAPLRFSTTDIVAAVDRERERTAKILHDSQCQTLGALALTVPLVERGLERGHTNEELKENCGKLRSMTRESLHQTQYLALSLQGHGSLDQDLVAALDVYIKSLSRIHPCRLTVAGDGAELSAERSLQLLRIGQGSVELARAAGGREEIVVTLHMAPDVVRLEIQARGIKVIETGSGDPFSLPGLMRLRADSIGARLEIAPGSVECELSLPVTLQFCNSFGVIKLF